MTESIRVLHVDDDPEFAEFAATCLEREDEQFTVTTATDASEGIEQLDAGDFDCIVSDYDMPGQNGIDFLKTVRQAHPELPFILFTDSGSEEIASAAISAGVTDYMQKGGGTDQYTLLANRIANSVEQYRAEKEASEIRQRLQELTENTTDCLWMFNRDWDELLFISGYEHVWDRPTEAIENDPRDFLNGVEPRDRDAAERAMDRLSNGDSVDVQLRIRKSDGEQGWVWMKGEPIFDNRGNVVRVAGFTRDITDRKSRHEKLEEFETIIEALSDAVYVLDEQGRFTYVNNEFVDLVGYERDGILGKTPSLIKDESAVETAERHLGRLLSDDGPDDVTFEVTIRPGDGEPLVCEDHMGVLPFEGDSFNGSVGTLRDITEFKQRERELERQNDLFAKAQDIAHVGAWTYDVRTEESYLTEKAYEIHGLSPDEDLHPEKSISFYHPDDQPLIRDAFERAVQEGRPYDLELRLTDASGEQRWVRTRGDPQWEDGTIVGVQGTLQDITDRKERQEELERRTRELEELTTELEEQYQYLFEKAPVMAVVTRAEDGTPTIDDCNQLFVETLGYEKADVIGRDLQEFYSPESERKLLEEGGYERALAAEFVREDRELVTADGDTVETLLRAVPRRDAREDTEGTLALYIDISERKQLQREKERLEEFTNIVSHDLRNPLNVARSRAELVEKDCDSEHLDAVLEAHDRMEELIEDLLTYAQSGDAIEGLDPVNIAHLCEDCWVGVVTEDATLQTDITEVIRADRSRLQQLLENLYRNAIEHGGSDVTVTVGERPGGFYVEDDGPGIPVEDRETVFEAGHSSSKKGTGFGLSIVEQIVEAHGWEIQITDGSSGGARFEITGVEFVET